MLLVPARSFEPEIMDRPDNSAADLRMALRDLRAVNRFLGGRKALLRTLRPFLLRKERRLEVLDAGTGGGDLPVEMVRDARSLGCALSVTAIDIDPNTVAIAAANTAPYPEIRVVRADAFHPPFPANSFDVVTASLLLHHLTDPQAVRLLETLCSLARVAVVVNDLRRHVVPWGFIYLAARVTRCHPMVVHDGPLSVLRGFTTDELRRLACDTGTPGATVRRSWPFRLVLTLPCAERA